VNIQVLLSIRVELTIAFLTGEWLDGGVAVDENMAVEVPFARTLIRRIFVSKMQNYNPKFLVIPLVNNERGLR
jgi:hypothetical protein